METISPNYLFSCDFMHLQVIRRIILDYYSQDVQPSNYGRNQDVSLRKKLRFMKKITIWTAPIKHAQKLEYNL